MTTHLSNKQKDKMRENTCKHIAAEMEIISNSVREEFPNCADKLDTHAQTLRNLYSNASS